MAGGGGSVGGELVEVLGVYNADGGWRGEAAYVVGKVLGRAHCGLCDVTHSPVRRKDSWDALLERARVPIRVVHRNELSDAEAEALVGLTLPLVLGRYADGRDVLLLSAEELDALGGSVRDFADALPAGVLAD